MAPDRYIGGDRLAVSLTHALTFCQPSAAARDAAYQPVKCPDCSSIRTDFTSVLDLDSSANLARASHLHHPQVDSVHYGNALISSHLLTLGPRVPCLADIRELEPLGMKHSGRNSRNRGRSTLLSLFYHPQAFACTQSRGSWLLMIGLAQPHKSKLSIRLG